MKTGSGGFLFPQVYRDDKKKLKRLLSQGQQDLVELSRWSLADDFMHYVLKQKFLEFADKTYPSPRRKTEVPVWFLICTQLLLRIYSGTKYSDLNTLLKSGTILSRVGFNIGKQIGFNDKNRYERDVPCNQDTVRKFFKDSKVSEMRDWFCSNLQEWFLRNNAIDTDGIYIIDQSHVVVPDNKNYADSIRIPIDEHGQFYKGTKEQIDTYKWHPCYTLSTLLNLNRSKNSFHFAGYEFGPGNEDELVQARRIIERYVTTCGKGVIKLLIADRGYISGEFVNFCKLCNKCDVLFPLRTDMAQYIDAVNLSKVEGTRWCILSDPEQENAREQGEPFKITSAVTIKGMRCLWKECKPPLYITVIKDETGNNFDIEDTKYFVLCSTRKFLSPAEVYQHYRLRSRVEECFRQIKHVWMLGKFTSPHRSLMEAHVGFILLTYSLLNLYLRKTKQNDLVGQFLSSIKKEAMASDADKIIVAYANDVFGLFGIKEYLQIVCQLDQPQRQKFMEGLNALNQR